MTIYDLNWQPARIGVGFFATCEFDDGIKAHLRSEDGVSFRITLDLRGDGWKIHDELDRARANSLLGFYERAHSV